MEHQKIYNAGSKSPDKKQGIPPSKIIEGIKKQIDVMNKDND